ncbi:BAHD acyltransferase BIA1-like [Euphorbia lathyris]|uniref:BAHD acyltransferase BIA1-like n=1 Tax=Euphorbia lathyris TaxID=212925 RepID=UPI0033136A00
MEANVEIINKQIIKPSSSTPNHLKNFKLSLLDQLAPVCYGPLLFFYSNITAQKSVAEISGDLKKSLSLTLTHFYPLAGRIKNDDAVVECNDDGVVWVEAKVNSVLSAFLENPDAETIRNFIPVEIESPEAKIGSLVQVQATFFRCGGFAIGVCVSQKISDAVTAMTFINEWAAAAAAATGIRSASSPIKNAASVFPPQKFSFTKPPAKLKKEVYTTKRFVFNVDKIAALKARSVTENVKNPTRVEAVTGLIWKCAMNASRSNKDHSRLSIFSQSVNIRRRTVPPLPEKTLGNLAGHFASQATESEIELGSLVDELRKGLVKFGENYVKKLTGNNSIEAISESFREAGMMLEEGNIDFYISTSLCRFPFYRIDFGWGKPEWVTIPSGGIKNLIVMLDSKDGDGIEAWITLTEEDMAFFERDHELVEAADLNPAVNCSKSVRITSSL